MTETSTYVPKQYLTNTAFPHADATQPESYLYLPTPAISVYPPG